MRLFFILKLELLRLVWTNKLMTHSSLYSQHIVNSFWYSQTLGQFLTNVVPYLLFGPSFYTYLVKGFLCLSNQDNEVDWNCLLLLNIWTSFLKFNGSLYWFRFFLTFYTVNIGFSSQGRLDSLFNLFVVLMIPSIMRVLHPTVANSYIK